VPRFNPLFVEAAILRVRKKEQEKEMVKVSILSSLRQQF